MFIIYTLMKFSFLLVDLLLFIIMTKAHYKAKKTNNHEDKIKLNRLIVLFGITSFLAMNQLDKY